MRSIGILTLGCKVNTYESEYLINILKEKGYIIKDFHDICDVYIINTCTVTNNSDVKSRKVIRQAIKRNSDACIIAMGCFIEANKDIEIPGLDIIIGNKDKTKVPELIEEWFNNKETKRVIYEEELTKFEDMYINNFPGRTRAFVKIQDGCENFCSYCIIPFVRGKCRSKEEDKVIEEVKALVNNNYKEVVLTGIHTGSYGVDLDTSFADLLNKLVKIKGLERLRISSIETTELNEDVLDVLRNSKIIVDHLHIPIQAGDIIVGFPGETEELFKESMDTCKRIEFSKLHVFPFSERKGTKAIKLPNKVSPQDKKDRTKRLLELSKELELNYMNKYLNKEVEVLIEEYKEGYSYGHTGNYLYVKINKELPHNEIVKVKIKDIKYPYCIGE